MNAPDRIQQAADFLIEHGVIVAIRLGDGSALLDVCRALADGGIRVLELTLTTPGALDAIRELSGADDLLVGAGTVLTTDDVAAVAEAGGRFALSPVCNTQVLEAASAAGLLAIPGTSTPTEIQSAHEFGARFVKVFPSAPLGGAEYIRLVRGPLPNVPIIPTSGPTAETLGDYLDAGAVAVGVGGRELFPEGFTADSVKAAATKVTDAVTAWRAGNR